MNQTQARMGWTAVKKVLPAAVPEFICPMSTFLTRLNSPPLRPDRFPVSREAAPRGHEVCEFPKVLSLAVTLALVQLGGQGNGKGSAREGIIRDPSGLAFKQILDPGKNLGVEP